MDIAKLVQHESYGRLSRDCITGQLSDVKRVIKGEHGYMGGFLTQNSSSELSHATMLRVLFGQKNDINQTADKPVFYDLGCGVGALVAYAAHDKWLGLGAEFDHPHFKAAQKNIDDAVRAGLIKEGQARIAYGNFFPEGFKIESGDPDVDIFRGYLRQGEQAPRINFRDAVGIDVSDVDLFYHFQVELRNNILRFFAESAKSGALLAFVPTINDTESLPSRIDYLGSQSLMRFYRKR